MHCSYAFKRKCCGYIVKVNERRALMEFHLRTFIIRSVNGKGLKMLTKLQRYSIPPRSAGEKLEPLSRILASKSNKPVACKA